MRGEYASLSNQIFADAFFEHIIPDGRVQTGERVVQ